jgi:hypothetical protein
VCLCAYLKDTSLFLSQGNTAESVNILFAVWEYEDEGFPLYSPISPMANGKV